jgi:hypothetical protein
MGGEMKSTKGYGAARTSGMGLQDEVFEIRPKLRKSQKVVITSKT